MMNGEKKKSRQIAIDQLNLMTIQSSEEYLAKEINAFKSK